MSKLTNRITERPAPDYQHAFDACMMLAAQHGGPVALLGSTVFHANELFKRATQFQATFVQTHEVEGGAHFPEIDADQIQTLERWRSSVAGVIWAEPMREDSPHLLNIINRHLTPEGWLCILTSNWLSRRVPGHKQRHTISGDPPAGQVVTRRRLKEAGFNVTTVYGFHAPYSIMLGYAAQIAERTGRPHLYDRLLSRMRRAYTVKGIQARVCPVSVLIAKRVR